MIYGAVATFATRHAFSLVRVYQSLVTVTSVRNAIARGRGMSFLRTRYFGLLGASVGIAIILGASLGLAAAEVRKDSLVKGFNLTGGPLAGDMAPDQFLSCLPQESWNSLYVWDSQTQTWMHFFNPRIAPAFVNKPEVGGLTIVKRFTGVALIMDQPVQKPYFKDGPKDACS